jgi:O-antigen/teichoic acid export membrane protein
MTVLARETPEAHDLDAEGAVRCGGRPLPARAWVGKGLWAILDQACSAAANFIPSLLLARWLPPRDYGAFAVGMTLLFFAETLQWALIIEPMLVFGPRYYQGRTDFYAQQLLLFQLMFSAVCVGGLMIAAGASAVLAPGALAATFAALAGACPLVQYRTLTRCLCMLRLDYRLAVSGGLLHLLLVSAGLFALYRLGWVGIPGAIAVIGATCLVSGSWLTLQLGLPAIRLVRGRAWRSVLERHLRYARWSTPARVLVWLRSSAPFVVLPACAGLGASGAFRALLNLIMPAMNVNIALPSLFIPLLSRARSEPQGRRTMSRLLLVSVAPAVAYWLLLSLAGSPALDLLYKGKYSAHALLLPAFGLLPVIQAAALVFDCSFLVREKPIWVFWAGLVDAGLTYTVGILLIVRMGLAGALLAAVFTSTMNLLVLIAIHFWHRFTASGRATQPES